jgi:flagellin
MTRINTNVASLRGLRSLQKANSVLDTSLSRLSTGLKINSGKDNPAGLIASETLRSQISTIEQSIRNSNRANNVISTADSALGEIGSLLNQIRGLIQEGLNEGALSQDEIEANQLQIDAALSAINRISSNTTFAGDKLIDGSKSFTTEMTAADKAKLTDFQVNEALFGSSSTVEIDATVTAAAQKGELRYAGGDLTQAATLEVSGSRGSQVLFLGGASTVANIRDAINSVSDVTGVEAEVSGAGVAGSVTVATGGGNQEVTFTDARATAGSGDDATLGGSISVVFTNAVANSAESSVTSVVDDGSGNMTITIELKDDGGGNSEANLADLQAAIAANEDAAALVTLSGDATTEFIDAGGPHALTGGTNATLTLTSRNYGSAEFVDINVLSGTFTTTLNDDTTEASRSAGEDIAVQINGQAAQGKGLQATVKTSLLDASVNFAEASNVAGTNAVVTVTGGGSLFQIGQEVSAAGQIGIGIEAINTARLGGVSGKLYELGSGAGKSLLDVGPNVSGAALVDIVEEAINRVSTLRGRLGAVQQNVIDTNISVLSVALENISEARSQIIDTDFAEETANLTKGQILSQAGISVLSIANQNPAQVLSLLG